MTVLAISIVNHSGLTFSITNLALNNCTGSNDALRAGTAIAQNAQVADIFDTSNGADYSGTITIFEPNNNSNYDLFFSTNNGAAGYSANPDVGTGFHIDAHSQNNNDGSYTILFSLE